MADLQILLGNARRRLQPFLTPGAIYWIRANAALGNAWWESV